MNKIFCILLILAFISCAGKNNSSVVNYDGYIDLSGVNLNNSIVQLNGKWEFYSNQLLTPADFSDFRLNPAFVKVPDYWDNYIVSGQSPETHGYATYRISLLTEYYEDLQVYISSPQSAAKVFIDDEFAGSLGIVGKEKNSEIPEPGFIIADCPKNSDYITIVIQISNFNFIQPGLSRSVLIGTKNQIEDFLNRRFFLNIFLFSCLILFSILNIINFLLRRKDTHYLWFAVFSLDISAWTLLNNLSFQMYLMDFMTWHVFIRLHLLSLILSFPLLIKYLATNYKSEMSKYFQYLVFIISAIFSINIIISPSAISALFFDIFYIFITLGSFHVFFMLIKAIVNRKFNAIFSVTGFIGIFIAGIIDILSYFFHFGTFYIAPIAAFFFFIFQSIYMSHKNSRNIIQIENFNEQLENKIKKRTAQLEKQKEMLMHKNCIIENDLSLAKKMQLNILPSTPPDSRFSFEYIPMQQVGGDYFDFLKFRSANKTGIFIADVSGHGVSAAMITSMLKSTILQSDSKRQDPAELMKYINSILMNQTATYFISAFYGIVNFDDNEITYCSAGHNMPILISKNEIIELKGIKGIPLAIMNNEELDSMKKTYTNNTFNLKNVKKILLYTDGLTEATSKNDINIQFENIMINQIIPKILKERKNKFTEQLHQELIKFHGSEEFEDDICMIAVDLKKL